MKNITKAATSRAGLGAVNNAQSAEGKGRFKIAGNDNRTVDSARNNTNRAKNRTEDQPTGTKGTKGTRSRELKLKAEQTIELSNGDAIKLGGMATAEGERYVWLEQGRQFVVTSLSAWHAGGSEASQLLKAHGMTIVSGMEDVRRAVAQLRLFKRKNVIVRPGWSKNCFALASGHMIVPAGKPMAPRVFAASDGLEKAGTAEGWTTFVATPLAGHRLAEFAMMAPFAAPLLRFTDREDNFGFEFAGLPGRGKSTLQYLMASAAGPAVGTTGTTYWVSCNATINALETTLPFFNDMPLILEEAALVAGGAKTEARAHEMHRLIFRLAAGREKHRHGQSAGPIQRLVYFISTNRSIMSLLGVGSSAEADALADRNITLPILSERRFGVFDHKPEGWASTGAFADALKRSASRHYGHALPAFLQWLVDQRAAGPKKLQLRIRKLIASFITKSGCNSNDGSQRRVAEAFGIVYAAGVLAREAGVLPPEYRCKRSSLACYRLHVRSGRIARSLEDRLRVLMQHPDTIDLGGPNAATLTKQDLRNARAFLYTGRSGRRELLIRVQDRHCAFADWNELRDDIEFQQRLIKSKGRDTVKRRLLPNGEPSAFYSFNIYDLR